MPSLRKAVIGPLLTSLARLVSLRATLKALPDIKFVFCEECNSPNMPAWVCFTSLLGTAHARLLMQRSEADYRVPDESLAPYSEFMETIMRHTGHDSEGIILSMIWRPFHPQNKASRLSKQSDERRRKGHVHGAGISVQKHSSKAHLQIAEAL